MAEIIHLPHDSPASDIVNAIEEQGAVIVDEFVTHTWLAEFNESVQTAIEFYTPYDYGEPEAMEFLGHHTVRLNAL